MIKKLRRRFICVNMTILTCVMFSVLTAVFVLMYRSEVKVSEEIMDSIIANNRPQPGAEHMPPPDAPQIAPTAQDEAGVIVPLRNENPSTTAAATVTNTETTAISDEDYYLDDRYFEWFEDVGQKDNWDDDRNNDRWEDPGFRPPPPPEETDPMMTGTQPPSEQTRPSQEQQTTTTAPIQPGIPPASESTVPSAAATTTRSAQTTTQTVPPASVVTSTTVPSSESAESSVTTSTTTYLRGSIFLKVDGNNQIENITAPNGAPNTLSDMNNAIQQVLDQGENEGKIRLDDVEYRYRLVPEEGTKEFNLVLLDRSIELSTLSRLLFIFLIIAAIGLLILFGISVALANWAVKPVELAWEKQKQFVADASHELKTPLAVISTNTDVILANPEGTVREQEKWLHYIKDETVRMSKLVSNLLFIAKSDAKKIAPTMAALNLSDLVSSVCLVFEPVAFENGKLLESRIQDDICFRCDEDKMKQLLTILLDNAVIHSADRAQITVSLSQDVQEKIRIVVSNNAADIPKDKLERLFDRFYRLDESRAKRTGGSGLGLNIARTIAQFHGGTIVANSENGIVSFIVTL